MGVGDEPEAVEAQAVESRWGRFAEAIYGSIFVTGLVGALSQHNATARAAAVSVVSTTAVFWLAHVWAELLAERAATGKPGGWPRFLRLAWQEWPIVEAARSPFRARPRVGGRVRQRRRLRRSARRRVAQLLAWGVVVGRRTRLPWWKSAAAGVLDAALGLAIIGLEVLIH